MNIMSYVWGILAFILIIISFIMFLALINPNWINKRLKENQKRITRKMALACWLIFGFIGMVFAGIAAPSVSDKGTLASAPVSSKVTDSPQPTANKAEDTKAKVDAAAKVKSDADAKAKKAADDKKAAEAAAAKTPQKLAENAVHQYFGNKNADGKKDSIVTLNFNKDNGNLFIQVFGQENITDKLTKEGMWMDVADVLKAMKDVSDVKEIDFSVMMSLQDAYGKSSDEPVMTMNFGPDTLAKINWDNFIWSNIPVIAENYWEHPVIAKINTD